MHVQRTYSVLYTYTKLTSYTSNVIHYILCQTKSSVEVPCQVTLLERYERFVNALFRAIVYTIDWSKCKLGDILYITTKKIKTVNL